VTNFVRKFVILRYMETKGIPNLDLINFLISKFKELTCVLQWLADMDVQMFYPAWLTQTQVREWNQISADNYDI